MVERVIPWWRKALSYALSGIRSLLGGGRSNGDETPETTADQSEGSEIDSTVKETSPPFETASDETPEALRAGPVSEVVDKEAQPQAVLPTERAPAMTAEIRAILEAVDEVEAETVVAPAVLAVTETDYDATTALEKIELAVKNLKPEAMEVEVEMILPGEPDRTPSVEPEEIPPAEVEEAPTPEAEDTVAEDAGADAPEIVAETEIAPAIEEQAKVETEEQANEETQVAEAELAPASEEPAPAEPEIPVARQSREESAAEEETVAVETETAVELAPEAADEVPLELPAATPAAPENSVAETQPVAEPTPALASPSAPGPAPVQEKSEAEQKTAARVAAAVKAREESSDPSPFSIFVGQVYDGPLDLLLDLIRKQDIDIYDIPIAKITAQFLAYVNQLKASDMDVAGEFIYTASLLIHIKSKMLLPRTSLGPEDAAEDPRRELVERLLEHERFKNAAQMLQQKQMLEAATWTNPGVREFKDDAGAEPEIAADTTDLVRVFQEILDRARNRPIINVEEDAVTVGQMIQFLTRRLTMEDKPVALHQLLSHTRSERALIAMFLALLELVRLQAILLRQDRHFSEIFIKKHSGFEAAMDQGLASARDDWR